MESRRKQRLVSSEMLTDEQVCIPLAHSDPNVFKFPKLDFGMPAMGRAELERVLAAQLYLHDTYAVNDTGIDQPNPQDLASDAVTAYQNHRLAAVSWFGHVLPSTLALSKDSHSVLTPAVNVMDRYITTCTDLGEDLCQLLRNIGNVRAACLSLSIKMYSVYTGFVTEDTCKSNNGWAHKALPADSSSDTDNPPDNVFILSDVRGVEEAEKRIISTLCGAVFPTHCENMISALLIEVCGTDPIEWLRLQESLFSLLGKLRPGKVTREELSDLMRIWLRGCVVCNSSFVNTDVYKSLHRMSSMMCSDCRKRCVVKDTEAASVNGETESQGEPDMKVARLLSVE
ncbi:hypothetical protein DPEC_G00068270 [Dallia pectoralis]|uniref:Uncharacterized protein n=1 Tax=Dallia pectoralis TaxID=75939 RepID=A0ACC2H2C8_DALPE|nr:hypothetical protein DPEC_G00068270 [Dallia pectoralis]